MTHSSLPETLRLPHRGARESRLSCCRRASASACHASLGEMLKNGDSLLLLLSVSPRGTQPKVVYQAVPNLDGGLGVMWVRGSYRPPLPCPKRSLGHALDRRAVRDTGEVNNVQQRWSLEKQTGPLVNPPCRCWSAVGSLVTWPLHCLRPQSSPHVKHSLNVDRGAEIYKAAVKAPFESGSVVSGDRGVYSPDSTFRWTSCSLCKRCLHDAVPKPLWRFQWRRAL